MRSSSLAKNNHGSASTNQLVNFDDKYRRFETLVFATSNTMTPTGTRPGHETDAATMATS